MNLSRATIVRHPPRLFVGGHTLGFAFFGGAVSWLLHLVLGYGAAEGLCVAGALQGVLWGVTGIQLLLIALSVLCLGAALSALAVSRRLGVAPEEGGAEGNGIRFVRRAGTMSNALFAVIILAQSVPIFWWGRC